MSKHPTKVAVKVIKGNIQKALSKFKRKVKDSDHLFELKDRKEFTKPSVRIEERNKPQFTNRN